MSDYRVEDCETWARREIVVFSKHRQAKLIKIVPKPSNPPSPVLSGVKMPELGMVWPSPGWHYHYAILCGGNMYDESYPEGIPEVEFKNRFEFREYIDFIVCKEFQ